MINKNVAEIIVHGFNGFADDGAEKFVEVEGKKFVDDGTGQPKKDEAGNPVPFVEKQKPADGFKVEEADLEALGKVNPHVARMLEDAKKRADEDAKRDEEGKKKAEEEAAKKGEWQKLADERAAKLADADEKMKQKDGLLAKYKGTIEGILKKVLVSIPKEKQSLIPADYSERQKLEYIVNNAEVLGATSILGKGGDVPPNDRTPSATDEDKIVDRIEELKKKGGTRTAVEDKEMYDLAVKLKGLRLEKQNAKK